MEDKLLWQLEQDFKRALHKRLAKVIDGCSIKELLDMGFSNNYLRTDYCICLGYKSDDYNYYDSEYKLTDKFFNTMVAFDYWDEDSDGYTVCYVKLIDDNDIKNLEEV